MGSDRSAPTWPLWTLAGTVALLTVALLLIVQDWPSIVVGILIGLALAVVIELAVAGSAGRRTLHLPRHSPEADRGSTVEQPGEPANGHELAPPTPPEPEPDDGTSLAATEPPSPEPLRRGRDRPEPYVLTDEPMAVQIVGQTELQADGHVVRAHSLMNPRGLVRIGDHLLVMGEVNGAAAPGQLLVMGPARRPDDPEEPEHEV